MFLLGPLIKKRILMKLAEQVIGELRNIQAPKYPMYEKILSHAFDFNNPLFAEDKFSLKYLDLAENPEWFANSLIANSCLEGYGSEQIWKFADCLDNDNYAEKVRKHALDESRHSTMFITALELVFPNVLNTVDDDTKSKIAQMQPNYHKKSPPIQKVREEDRLFEIESINELIQVHITEIRALVLQYMVRKAFLKHSPNENVARLMKISNSLITDEARHINYSAEIFEHYANKSKLNSELFFFLFEQRMKDFNELTLMEIEREEIEL